MNKWGTLKLPKYGHRTETKDLFSQTNDVSTLAEPGLDLGFGGITLPNSFKLLDKQNN